MRLLTLIMMALLVALGKELTNPFCPSEVDRYGGDVCDVRLFQPRPDNDLPGREGRCFPGAHACSGFALLGLCDLSHAGVTLILSWIVFLGWRRVVGLQSEIS